MGGRGGGGRTVVESPGAQKDEDRIVTLLREMGPLFETWVSLRRLRDTLSGMSRERQDDAITRLVRKGLVSLLREDDVRARDRAAAFRWAGEDFHLIRITRG